MEEYYSTPKMDDQDETEETLSFCDIPIYSSESADWETSSKEDQSLSPSSTSSSSSDQDLFEFFSEEWSNSSTYPVQNIVFCGKIIIPFKEPEISTNTVRNLERKNPQKPRKQVANEAAKSGGRNGFCVRKVLFLGSPAKWRWNLLACGLGARFPAEMDLSDIRSRQRKRSQPAPLFLGGGGGDKKVGGGKGLWAMIKSLSGRHRLIRVVEG
ncbi:hypothetical protein RHSIM_Rhsim09G0153800 [Rhododendron simsii]|uniref:Uncharacterized protein n=1 Tax=Rhododendron simsii TaxID=118357 RepID=A0A834GDG7_RHOSS|nr:hypothetical protein RHSIM_Rhsim09G0153800 [Rhododendron simsii]